MADFETANLAGVNATDVLKQVRDRLLQLEVNGKGLRLAFGRTELQNLDQSRRRIQNDGTATNLDGFKTTEPKLLKDRNEAALR